IYFYKHFIVAHLLAVSPFNLNTISSSTGLTCLNWTNTTRDYDVMAYTDPQMDIDILFSLCSVGVGDHNYCRNPDSSEKPWCYVTGPDTQAQRQTCAIDTCKDESPTEAAEASPLITAQTEILEPAISGPGQGGSAAVQPVMGISQRACVRSLSGYVVGILMMAIIILLGVGITVGYFYKRARDLKTKHEQRVYEREMQRITLPLSAFSNPTCELVDENAIIITAEEQNPTQDGIGEQGGDPLMGQQAVTPGA
uniref:Kringle domain-containing protein n=1 Tax=Esox lucius TaxID=8010 RepID=A0AAY5K3Y5_ESOLU